MTDNTVRYDICDREDEPFMESCEDGDWVNFADYARLKARVAAADKLIEYLERWQAAAFMVYGNLDLDIEANPEARAIAEGKDDE